MRCGRCGNDNADANRFCGSCGAPLGVKPQSAAQAPSVASVGNVSPPASKPATQSSRIALESIDPTQVPHRSAPVSSSQSESRSQPGSRKEAVITGPSFLGLNQTPIGDEGVYRERNETTGGGALESSSRSLDYLLEDEEEPKRGGVKLFIVVVVIAIAVGIGYLRWRRGNFEWLGIKTAAVTTPSDSAPNGSEPSASGTGLTPDSHVSTPSAGAPANSKPADDAAPSPANSPATDAGSAPAASQTATPPPVPDGAPSEQPDLATGAPKNPGAVDAAPHSAASDSEAESTAEEPPPAPSKPAARKLAKPSAAKPFGATSSDSVAQAERYIYGRGVAQDCDHGLRLLKPAAGESNPKAMISLGALYSTGTCTPRDLPTAYRWFALALHKEPDNQVLQNDLQKLWSQMTQPERQLAIKLSQ